MVKSKLLIHLKNTDEDFLGGPVDTNPPAGAGDMGLILVREDSSAVGQPSPCATTSPCDSTTEAGSSRARAPRQEKPLP